LFQKLNLFWVPEEQGQIGPELHLIQQTSFGFWPTSLRRKERKYKEAIFEN